MNACTCLHSDWEHDRHDGCEARDDLGNRCACTAHGDRVITQLHDPACSHDYCVDGCPVA